MLYRFENRDEHLGPGATATFSGESKRRNKPASSCANSTGRNVCAEVFQAAFDYRGEDRNQLCQILVCPSADRLWHVTTAVTGVAVGEDFRNERPSTATPVHGNVRTRDAFLSL